MKFLRAAIALLGVAILGWLATPTTAHALPAPHARVARSAGLTAGAPALAIHVRDACELEEAREFPTGAAVVPVARLRQRLPCEVLSSEYIGPLSGALRSTSLPARK